MLRKIVLTLLALSAAACATSFTGEARFPGGPHGCYEKCAKDGMEMGSFVYAGEFSSACVCQPRGAARGPAASSDTTGAMVGVMTQMRAQQQHAMQR